MRRWIHWFVCLLVVLGFAVPRAGAQQISSGVTPDAIPEPPAFLVEDEAGFFARKPEKLRAISDRLREVEQKYGFKIYFLVKPVIFDGNATELADRLQRAWLPDGGGLVVVYQSDGRALGVSRGFDVMPSESGLASSKKNLPSLFVVEMLDRIQAKLKNVSEGDELVDRLATLLTGEVDGYLSARNAPPPARSGWVGMLAAGGGLAVLLGLTLVAGRWLRRRGEKRDRTFRFPPAPDSQRLGAPFGARVSSRSFGGAAAPESPES